jgi:hypothetical protein
MKQETDFQFLFNQFKDMQLSGIMEVLSRILNSDDFTPQEQVKVFAAAAGELVRRLTAIMTVIEKGNVDPSLNLSGEDLLKAMKQKKEEKHD